MEKFDFKQISMFVVAGILGGMITLWGVGFFGEARYVSDSRQSLSVEEESATISAVQKVLPSVVAITTRRQVQSFFGGVFEAEGGGSGFVITSDGLIVTNKHVADSDTTSYSVITNDGKNYDAQVVARDPMADLAVLKIEAQGLPTVEFGDSDNLELGQKVIAIGNALGEYQNSVTTGVVSGVGRQIVAGDGAGSSETLAGVIQTDAAINPGNSGGPLINLAGQVIGINTAIDQQGSLIGFAIPINSVKTAIDSVVAGGVIERPKLGVRYILITPELAAANDMEVMEGALVQAGQGRNDFGVEPGGPADRAGIEEGDVIVAIGDQKISGNFDLIAALQKYKPGDTVDVRLLSRGQEKVVSVTLGKL